MCKYPQVFDFLASSIQEKSVEVKDVIKNKVAPLYHQGTKKIYEDIDYSKFREDIDVGKAIEILNWTMFGFGEKSIQQMSSFKSTLKFGAYYLKEWKRYSEILKFSFYK